MRAHKVRHPELVSGFIPQHSQAMILARWMLNRRPSKINKFRVTSCRIARSPLLQSAQPFFFSAHLLPIPGTKNAQHLTELLRGTQIDPSAEDLARIEQVLPVGWAHGDRYTAAQWLGPERYC
mgnify:CR=1 FL=1